MTIIQTFMITNILAEVFHYAGVNKKQIRIAVGNLLVYYKGIHIKRVIIVFREGYI